MHTKQNKQTLLFLFIFQSRSGYQSSVAMLILLDSVIMLSLSDVLHDEGNFINYDNICPCDKRKKTLNINRTGACSAQKVESKIEPSVNDFFLFHHRVIFLMLVKSELCCGWYEENVCQCLTCEVFDSYVW